MSTDIPFAFNRLQQLNNCSLWSPSLFSPKSFLSSLLPPLPSPLLQSLAFDHPFWLTGRLCVFLPSQVSSPSSFRLFGKSCLDSITAIRTFSFISKLSLSRRWYDCNSQALSHLSHGIAGLNRVGPKINVIRVFVSKEEVISVEWPESGLAVERVAI